VSYAANEGYATLAIDRLGNGQSSHPNALTTQIPLQVEILHLIIEAARSGNLPLPEPYSGARFDKIIAVGHSLGSMVVNALNWRYAADADGTVLTGYAIFSALQLGGVLPNVGLAPAIGLPIGYLEITSYSGWLWLFYSEELYDPGLESYDWNHRGTATLGEVASIAFGSQKAYHYTGPVNDHHRPS
jgi:pimeloyl-ACP methyl ester carboxylesterase